MPGEMVADPVAPTRSHGPPTCPAPIVTLVSGRTSPSGTNPFVLFADGDPITGPFRDPFRELVPTAEEEPDVWVESAGHFLQEDAGEACAERVVEFVDRR